MPFLEQWEQKYLAMVGLGAATGLLASKLLSSPPEPEARGFEGGLSDRTYSPQATMGKRTGVLLVQLGTPDSTKVGDVRKYLREFLMDERVIDIPFMARWLLVQCIIAPFRSPGSAKLYEQVWEERGSPLKFHSVDLTAKLQEKLGENYLVKLGMRYQSPSIRKALCELREASVEKILVVPLFPQYASATSGSVHQRVMHIVSEWQTIPEMQFVSNFIEEPKFLEAWVSNAEDWRRKKDFDHYLFSYHGLPVTQIKKGSCGDYCKLGDCCGKITDQNRLCYRAQCFETSRRIADRMGIPPEKYTVCFQSRLGNAEWVQPYTEDTIHKLCESGVKRLLALSPAFVADCLETTQEVGMEYRELFLKNGGEEYELVESLNVSPLWVECLEDIVKGRSNSV